MVVFFFYLLIVWILNPGDNPFRSTVFYLPIIVGIQLALTMGLALAISALNTFYEDVKYMVSVGLYLLLFLSPIMYFSEQVYYANGIPEEQRGLVYTIYHLNPIAMLMTAYRKVMLDPQEVTVSRDGVVHDYPYLPLDWTMVGVAALVSLATLVFGYWLFNRRKWQFVERP